MTHLGKFLPILLGTDLNAYGMARAFHEEYGVKSLALGEFSLIPTRHSSIVEVRIFADFGTQQSFLENLNVIYEEYHKKFSKLLLVACGDNYVEFVVKNKKILEKRFVVSCVSEELFTKLATKLNFYKACEQFGLDYPITHIITKKEINVELPFAFPVVLKADDSAKYTRCKFVGQKKTFFIESKADLTHTIECIYKSAYDGDLVVQEMITGTDDTMRVLNCYVGKDSKVKLMCLGQVLLEDKAPQTVGNYLAIINEYQPEICEKVKLFLESLGYMGFANFDMKFDSRDGKFKFFEINLRQGRSSFFVTGSGFNLAKYLVKDWILEEPLSIEISNTEHLWLGLPKKLLMKNVNEYYKGKIKKLVAGDRFCSTLSYKKDRNFFRFLQNARISGRYWFKRGWEGKV